MMLGDAFPPVQPGYFGPLAGGMFNPGAGMKLPKNGPGSDTGMFRPVSGEQGGLWGLLQKMFGGHRGGMGADIMGQQDQGPMGGMLGGPMSGMGMAGGPMSGMGMLGGGDNTQMGMNFLGRLGGSLLGKMFR